MRKNLSLLFLGAVLVIFGVVWGGSRVGLLPFDVFFDGWWSLILIVIAVYGMLSHGVKVFDVILLILGVVLVTFTSTMPSTGPRPTACLSSSTCIPSLAARTALTTAEPAACAPGTSHRSRCPSPSTCSSASRAAMPGIPRSSASSP